MSREILNLILYLFVYSFFGWILESVYKSVLQKKIINSGFLYGPVCPIYGYGALIMYLSLKDFADNYFLLFFFGFVVLSVFEYVVGLGLEIIFKTKYWDYSEQKFNIHGRVCLKNSLYWGVLGIVFMKGIHPFIERWIDKVPTNIGLIVAGILIAIMVTDTVLTIVKLVKINNKLASWKKVTDEIRNRIESLADKGAIQFNNIKSFDFKLNLDGPMKKISEIKDKNQLLEILKQEQEELQTKLEKRIARLKKAFPTMNSENLTNFLNNRNQKRDEK